MTSSIKPPGGPKWLPATEPPGAASKTDKATQPLSESVQGTTASGAAGASDPIAELARAMQAGEIDVAGAVDRLVERALSTGVQLTGAQRAELEQLLRAAVADDPTLQALTGDLS